jgi:5-azacytidine-induced protein 1
MQVRLESQKNDYEAIIQRHLNFIDQLIDDKKNLSEKCESLVKELKDIEKTHISKIKHLEEK